MAAKQCSKCGEFKPATTEFFHKHAGCKGGLHTICKVCHQARARLYAIENAERIKAQRKQYRIENRDRLIAVNRYYYAQNKAAIIPKQVEYNRRNREAYLAKMRAWRKANPEKVQVWVRNRRAKLKGLAGSHTIADILALLAAQKGRCVYCKCDIRNSYQVDHIVPVALGGSNDKSNLQLLCKPCNLDKRAKDPLEYQRERGMLL